MGFIRPKPSPASQEETGKAVLALCDSASKSDTDPMYAQFRADPHGWLFANGFLYYASDAALAAGNGTRIPPDIRIEIVVDTDKTMHVRIPAKGDVIPPGPVQDESYGGSFNRFLAGYFARKCR